MGSRLTLTFIDHDSEIATAGVEGVTLSAVNFEAQNGLMDTLRAKIDAIVLVQRWQEVRVASVARQSQEPPVDKNAQRETKWSVLYQDTVNFQQFNVSIPGADLSLLKDGTGEADPEDEDIAAFITAFEAFARSPYGNTVEVLKIFHVGRRN